MRHSLVFLVLSAAALLAAGPSTTTAAAEAPAQTSATLMDKGVVELEGENYAGAIRLFEQAATADPRNALAFSYLGRGYDAVGDTTKAYKFYGIALDIDPDEVMALSWSGRVDVLSDNLDLAGEKLARLERVCGAACGEYRSLKRAIDDVSADERARP